MHATKGFFKTQSQLPKLIVFRLVFLILLKQLRRMHVKNFLTNSPQINQNNLAIIGSYQLKRVAVHHY